MKSNIREHNKDIERLLKEEQQLKLEISENQIDQTRYESVYEKLTAGVQEVKEKHHEVTATFRQKMHDKNSWSERVVKREKYIVEINDKITKIKENIYVTEQDIEQSHILLDRLDGKLSGLKSEQDHLNRTYSTHKDKKLQLDKETEFQKSSIVEKNAELKDISSRVLKFKTSIEQKENEIPRLEESNANVRFAIKGA